MSATKSQVDRLGERLRTGEFSDADLKELDAYRRSFAPAYAEVVSIVREVLNVEPTGRSAKSTTAIVEKLQRETIRLSQMQDIAGCRLVVADVSDQDLAVQSLSGSLPHSIIVDRRDKPSHGYRAVHVIARPADKPVEIQVRTSLQHLWAELSEKMSDIVDSGIKYGSGDPRAVDLLRQVSDQVAFVERAEAAGELDKIGEYKRNLRKRLELVIQWISGFRGRA